MAGSHSQLHSDKKEGSLSCKQICFLQIFAVIVFAAGVAGGICIGIYVYHDGPNSDTDSGHASNANANTGDQTNTVRSTSSGTHSEPSSCPQMDPVSKRSYEDSIYAPLTPTEMNKAAKALLDNGVVSTIEDPTSLAENFILYQRIDPPVKSEALEYLDNDGAKPKRFAKVTVQRGGVSPPDVMEYRVGPLDGQQITVTPKTSPGDIHFNSRPYDMLELTIGNDIVAQELALLSPLLAESFDGAQYPRDVYINPYNGPPSTSGTERNVRCVHISNIYQLQFNI